MSSPSNSSAFPNEEQKAILESLSRITIVKAAPGSGKTTVFIEYFRRKLSGFEDRKSGIAALSFTNAAYGEISKRLDVAIGSQHFVGTLDSFLLRFVVRPFAHLVGVNPKGVELLPSPLDESLTYPQVSYGGSHKEKTSLFSLKFSSGNLDNPVFTIRNGFNPISVGGSFAERILKDKFKWWKTKGSITHSDCHYLAAYILSHNIVGPKVRELIAKRFPLILVDEFQDTGCFLSLALHKVLEDSRIKALIVGDPDQSIFEFSGAKPELFSDLQSIAGASTQPITRTQRCSPAICEIAKYLSDTGTALHTTGEARGRQILFVHSYDAQIRIESNLTEILKGIAPGSSEIAFLCRSNKLIRQLQGDYSNLTFQGSSSAGQTLAEAVEKLKQGHAREAFKLASSKMSRFAFADEAMSRRELEEKGISFSLWKRQIFILLKEIAKDVPGETWNGWLLRARSASEVFLKNLGAPQGLGIYFKRNQTKGTAIKNLVAIPNQPLDEFLVSSVFKSIHGAKGSEYNSVVVFFPKPHGLHAPCISKTWFNAEGSTEEKRVGYVALTRAKNNLVLCVHKKTYSELKKNYSEFVAKFEVILAV